MDVSSPPGPRGHPLRKALRIEGISRVGESGWSIVPITGLVLLVYLVVQWAFVV